jgi:uncharacterized membrane protein
VNGQTSGDRAIDLPSVLVYRRANTKVAQTKRPWGSTSTPGVSAMSDLVAIVYPSEAKAEEVRQKILKLQKEYLIAIHDAVIAVKTGDAVKLNQLVNTTMAGAAGGSFWGLLFGIVFLNPLIGVALGTGAGALSGALTDFGIKDQFMKDLASKVKSGDAVLFLLIKSMTADKVLNEIKDAGGTVLKTSLDEKKEQFLRDTLAAATQAKAA